MQEIENHAMYRILRYESVTLNPKQLTEDIYRFLVLTVPENVVSWVIENTGAKSNTSG